MSEFLPRSDADLVIWLNNFALKFAANAVALGFLPADVTAVQTDATTFQYLIQLVEASKDETRERVAYKDVLRDGMTVSVGLGSAPPTLPTVTLPPPPATLAAAGILPRLRALVRRIKVAAAYTVVLGLDLGIEASLPTPPPATSKPTLTLRVLATGSVEIRWNKGVFDGVRVQSRRGTEVTWSELGTDARSPFTDTRANLVPTAPEVRLYRLVYQRGESDFGAFSDVVSVTVTP